MSEFEINQIPEEHKHTKHINPGTDTTINPVIINDTHRQKQQPPHPQPMWVYKREPAGMGEWCYRIYRNNHYMVYAESESIAMIICNGLNRDEQPHTPAQPTEAQQRFDAALHYISCREAQRYAGLTIDDYKEAIALLQAGRK